MGASEPKGPERSGPELSKTVYVSKSPRISGLHDRVSPESSQEIEFTPPKLGSFEMSSSTPRQLGIAAAPQRPPHALPPIERTI